MVFYSLPVIDSSNKHISEHPELPDVRGNKPMVKYSEIGYYVKIHKKIILICNFRAMDLEIVGRAGTIHKCHDSIRYA